MKVWGKVASSVAAIGLSAALIAGSTFALFTNESKTNIAITSGKVKVTSAVTELAGTSVNWNGSAYDNKPVTVIENVGTFTNGGTFTYNAAENTLNIERITPGDYVTFKIQTTNDSNIAIKYQTIVTLASGDTTLFTGLEIEMDSEPVKNKELSTAVSEWKNLAAEAAVPDISVSIGLPVTADNTYMVDEDGNPRQCSLTIGVYAVQQNGHDTTHGNVHLISQSTDLGSLLETVQNGDTLALNGNVEITEEAPLSIPENKDLAMDVQSHTLSVVSGTKSGISIPKGSSLTLKGAEKEESGTSDVVLNSKTTNKAAVEVTGDGSELNLENVEIKCENDNTSTTGSIPKASIEVSNKANVSFNGSVIDVRDENETITDFKNPQAINATGAGTTVSIEETTVNIEGTAVALSVADSAQMDIENSEINIINGGGSCPALMVDGGGEINSVNNTFNVTGDVRGTNGYNGNYPNAVAVIGDYPDNDMYGIVNIYGGVINLNPTSGRAYAVATSQGNQTRVFVGGGLIINVNAEAGAFAAAFAIGQQSPVGYYSDPGELTVNLTETDDDRNVEIWRDSLWYNAGGGFLPESGKMPNPLA